MSELNDQIKPKKSLYDFTIETMKIIDLIDQNEGELTPETEELLNQELSGGEEKVKGVYRAIKKFKTDADYLDAMASVVAKEVDRLKSAAKTNVNKAERLSKAIEAWMKVTGTEKLKFDEVDIILRKTTEYDPPADPNMLAKLPAECWTTPAPPAIAKANFKAWAKANPADAEFLGVVVTEKKSILVK